ncbi:outer membrane beta-barrel protein [Ancylobacter dichloromethanicus]|uniref:outer membrane beta-barrel protein n=1 Tax=Ancylobacter dichloromethanicus TaxID=518825 RepID=UPI001BCDE378|nr:outer membrane beta-barrel protein [Ancylobacter dichloromethanicus]MBS7554785.1 outer membrane beta-barrel protein [Ancylobacter dichloromethanicus]
MRAGTLIASCLCLCIPPLTSAVAADTAIGASYTTERVIDDFSATKSSDWQVDITHTFDNKVSIGGAVKYYDTAGTSDSKTNAQIGIGYTVNLEKLALTGSVGVGQHFIHSDDSENFPYYYVSLAGALPINDKWTWNAFRLRYRNAFDSDNDYNTPEVATGVSYKVDGHNSLSLMVVYDWSESEPSYTGLEFGYKYHF